MREPPPPSTPSRSRGGRSRLAWWMLACALVAGGILRLAWISDMEWKDDERWSYRMSQEVGRSRPWPAVGMPTSLGFSNPGLSVWIFVPIGRMAGTPTSMARAIVLLNMIGLVGFACAVRAYLPAQEREPWIWGLALHAVSPFAIRLSRKIWPPSILTPLLLLLWMAHRHRQSRWGAFGWGLLGALIGQVHLSGWFVAAGLAIGTAVAEWRGRLPRSRYWHWWVVGGALGLSMALPWVRALPGSPISLPPETIPETLKRHIFGTCYYLVASATSAFPFSSLGLGRDTAAYRIVPIVDGVPMHLVDVLSGLTVLLILIRILVRLIGALGRGRIWRRSVHAGAATREGDTLTSAGPSQADTQIGATRFYLWSTIGIPSILYILTTNVYFYHYFYVLCPFLFVLVAACMLPWRRVLLGLVIAQAVMSATYLTYLHQNGGTRRGEYGPSYARQGNR
jgi:hypothetical protein